MADKKYKAHLIQHEWVTTEVFEIDAKDEKAAKAEADKIIKTKDLDGREFKLEIVGAEQAEEATEPSPAAAPSEPEER